MKYLYPFILILDWFCESNQQKYHYVIIRYHNGYLVHYFFYNVKILTYKNYNTAVGTKDMQTRTNFDEEVQKVCRFKRFPSSNTGQSELVASILSSFELFKTRQLLEFTDLGIGRQIKFRKSGRLDWDTIHNTEE